MSGEAPNNSLDTAEQIAQNAADRLRRARDKFSVRDVLAGITTAVVAIPEAMANAALVGVNPVQGLYALAAGTPVAALATSSTHLTVAVTAAMSLAIGDALYVVPVAERGGALATLVLMVGVFNILVGVLKWDVYLRFVSNSVVRGFLTGVAFALVLNQLPALSGWESGRATGIGRGFDIVLHPARAEPATLAVGALTVALILLIERSRFARLATPFSLVIVSVLTARAGWAVALVRDVGAIPRQVPAISLPDPGQLVPMALPALAVALIGLIQSAGLSRAIPNPDGTSPVIARDFVGQGVGNIASGLFGGIAVGGSMSATSLNLQSGAKSRWANVILGVVVLAVLLLIAPLVEEVPMASLAAVLVIVGIRAVDAQAIRTVWSASLASAFTMAATFVATLLMPLQYAVLLGAALSVLQYVYTSSLEVQVIQWVRDDTGRVVQTEVPATLPSRAITILDIRGSIFYAGADVIERDLPDPAGAEMPVVILRLRDRIDLGSTFLGVLLRYHESLAAVGGQLMLSAVGPGLYSQLERTQILDEIGEHNVFRATRFVTESTEHAIHDAEAWLASR